MIFPLICNFNIPLFTLGFFGYISFRSTDIFSFCQTSFNKAQIFTFLTGVVASHLRTANLLFRCEKRIIAKCAVDESFCRYFVKNSESISLFYVLNGGR